MPRRSKGPRLYLRPARRDEAGKITHHSLYFIRDGVEQHGTGLGPNASDEQKSEALRAYLAKRYAKDTETIGSRDPKKIPITDVFIKYLRDKEPDNETLLRFKALRRFWTGKFLSEVIGDTCNDYVAFRRAENEQKLRKAQEAKVERLRAKAIAAGKPRSRFKLKPIKVTDGAARRELEDLRAAINYHRNQGLHDRIVSVALPAAGKRRERWLTRSEAAHLILTTWRYREVQNFRGTNRRTRQHVARFMVVARYMGSRASVICEASIEPNRPIDRAWVDLRNGIFYGLPEVDQETNKRRQTVRVPPAFLAHLRRWRARGQRYVVEWNGEPVKRVSKAHAAAVAAAGFGPDVTPHTWRHTLATWLAQTSINDHDAADYLAMTAETFQRVYRHQRPDFSASVHRAMNEKRTA